MVRTKHTSPLSSYRPLKSSRQISSTCDGALPPGNPAAGTIMKCPESVNSQADGTSTSPVRLLPSSTQCGRSAPSRLASYSNPYSSSKRKVDLDSSHDGER